MVKMMKRSLFLLVVLGIGAQVREAKPDCCIVCYSHCTCCVAKRNQLGDGPGEYLTLAPFIVSLKAPKESFLTVHDFIFSSKSWIIAENKN